ncbi:hypothetical protein LZ575_15080 [Antarcticibacterium sp. 1MA-6-2]|uniref:DUF4175 family protein n=1 Tax=Antarcticibacterium sp. 1MA-6-2 TaxID=2908210 RepID=UPI001F48B62A|nr:DUF4175 family protein [Antarcticibacterium sp. 1MA-6-2]UJH90210.1 hypothetical protein LZ575_15080 [Antarcticibacterium sp. 1MA-6-2]
MEEFNYIKKQLEEFIRRYYLNELLKGSILFFSIWLLYFLLILFIEHFFWLSPPNRSILFWLFIAVSAALLFRFILIPLARLFKLSKGIDEIEASRIIGKHFPEVNDKLLNVLQLKNNAQQSDLLMAGIAQKSKELKPVPFKLAVNFNSSLRYLKYAAFPILIVLAIFITGNQNVFSDSYERVVHYKTAYEPPAPFSFHLEAENLKVEEGSSFPLRVNTTGSIAPETVAIHFNDESYFLRNTGPATYEYVFQGIKEDIQFYLSANGVTSRSYVVEVVEVPKILDFQMSLNYPRYLNKPSEAIKGTGNITVPEGTEVSWNLQTKATGEVLFSTRDTIRQFENKAESFNFSTILYFDVDYQITTSNSEVEKYESLRYSVAVIKDQFPEINVQHKRDSIDGEELYFFGKVSDDHGISKLNLVYYNTEEGEEASEKVSIPVNREVFNEFFQTFPGNVKLEKGTNYNMYFEVFDNDGVHGAKRSESELFSYREKSDNEVQEENLQKQGESIRNLSESLEKTKLSEKELEELSRLQKEKEQLNFNDRKKMENFLERQKQQTEMMKNYSEKLKKSLQSESPQKENEFKKELEQRLARKEERLEENENLLEELQKYADKLSREELTEKLEKLAKQNTNEQKSLEQILELMKRYYVQEKTFKIANDLLELGEKQEAISEKDSANTPTKQEEITKEFEDTKEELDELEKENEGLKKPMKLGREEEDESEISDKQKEAYEKLEQNDKSGAKQKQKEAGQKMKEMGQKMKAQQAMGQGEQLEANMESLRQILDNLMVFSFEQEELLLTFRGLRPNAPTYANELKKQQVLKEHFRHVDDSLFALAVNNPMISEKITSKLTDIEFDIDKSLERLAQNEIPQGTASQQYVMTGTNDLALMLSEVFDNMQQMMNASSSPGEGPGQGGKGGKQLKDIIMSQDELNEMMKEGLGQTTGEKPGEQGEGGEGEKGQEKGSSGQEKGTGGEGENEERQQEEMSGKLFEIFKQQQLLKQQLQNKLREAGEEPQNSGLLREMEQVEREILENGFNQRTLDRMNRISHRMLELENASFEQEEEERRTAKTNLQEFQNNAQDQNLKAKEYFNSTEILNRQTLPLRQIYKAKVKQYFEAFEN